MEGATNAISVPGAGWASRCFLFLLLSASAEGAQRFHPLRSPRLPRFDSGGGDTSSKPAEITTTLPRADYLSWDDYFMAVAFLSSQRSKGVMHMSTDRALKRDAIAHTHHIA